jgi:hypothetical protein
MCSSPERDARFGYPEFKRRQTEVRQWWTQWIAQ